MPFDYQSYLASREWALKREAVRRRSGNQCERMLNDIRCHRPHQSTHHHTYANTGHEPLEDLMALCNPCHRWISGKAEYDLLAQEIEQRRSRPPQQKTQSLAEFLRTCDICGESDYEGSYVYGEFPHWLCRACLQGLERRGKLNWDIVDSLHVMLVVRRYFDEQLASL